jgi:hypothetical protein
MDPADTDFGRTLSGSFSSILAGDRNDRSEDDMV